MTTDEHTEPETGPPVDDSNVPVSGQTAPSPSGGATTAADETRPAPSWWHREHPTFTSLAGFFTGLVVVIAVPGTFGAILNQVLDDDTATRLFPFVAVIFAVPLVLIAFPRTRRFGGYMLLGMVVTAVVVIGVTALTLWALISRDG